jgi:hypothetical protein
VLVLLHLHYFIEHSSVAVIVDPSNASIPAIVGFNTKRFSFVSKLTSCILPPMKKFSIAV